jgi:CheY-like chemotaxis protein
VEGLIEYLQRVRHEGASPAPVHAEWLARAAGLADAPAHRDITTAWAAIAAEAGARPSALAERAAEMLGLRVADLSQPSRSALRLVPESLIRSARVLPIAEDGETVTVAAADPTLLTAELELLRLTGRRPVFAVVTPDGLGEALAALVEIPPASTATRRAVKAPDGAPSGFVLVVDDDPGDRLIARRVLEKLGYPVVDASNGREALERLAAEPSVSLVVADLNMPELDGLELIWAMREAERWAHIPVIVLTGETDELLESKLIEEGADDYLSKPFDPRVFGARVGATLRRAGGARP